MFEDLFVFGRQGHFSRLFSTRQATDSKKRNGVRPPRGGIERGGIHPGRLIWVFPKIVVPPKSSILIRFSIINHPFWGTPIFGNIHMEPANDGLEDDFPDFNWVIFRFHC